MPRRPYSLTLGMAVVAFALLPIAACAQNTTPVRQEQVQAGPYGLLVRFYAQPHSGQRLPFSVDPATPSSGLQYQIEAVPLGGTDAVPVRASITQHGSGVSGNVNIPVRGFWSLRIAVSGPSGADAAEVSFIAVPPIAIPAWLAWLIGLLPCFGMLLFLLIQPMRAAATESSTARP